MFIVDCLILPWWFSLPAYVANSCPGFGRALPFGKVPISVKYLGPNKTMMALPTAILGACIVAWLQSLVTHPLNYPQASWWIVGLSFGFGTVFGDWAKSFAKRQTGIAPGEKWWVEKIDFIVMSHLMLYVTFGALPVQYYLVPICFMLVVHGPGNRLSYRLGWRNSPH